jgi:hypothetical protein
MQIMIKELIKPETISEFAFTIDKLTLSGDKKKFEIGLCVKLLYCRESLWTWDVLLEKACTIENNFSRLTI